MRPGSVSELPCGRQTGGVHLPLAVIDLFSSVCLIRSAGPDSRLLQQRTDKVLVKDLCECLTSYLPKRQKMANLAAR